VDEGDEDDIELVEPAENAAKSLESSEQSFDLVALSVDGTVVFPRRQTISLGRNNRDVTQIKCQLVGLVALISTIHQQVDGRIDRTEGKQKLPALRRIVGVTGREGEAYGCSGICGNQMNFGGPPTSGFSDGLGAVFFNAPVPSGWTLMLVLSSETASIRIRMIC